MAYVFTYDKKWQDKFEKELKIIPVMTNDFGGKEYRVNKSLITVLGIKENE